MHFKYVQYFIKMSKVYMLFTVCNISLLLVKRIFSLAFLLITTIFLHIYCMMFLCFVWCKCMVELHKAKYVVHLYNFYFKAVLFTA